MLDTLGLNPKPTVMPNYQLENNGLKWTLTYCQRLCVLLRESANPGSWRIRHASPCHAPLHQIVNVTFTVSIKYIVGIELAFAPYSDFIERFYYRERRHGYIGNISPVQYREHSSAA